MAFDLTYEVNARVGKSVKIQADKLREEFAKPIPINLTLDKATGASINKLVPALKDVNSQLLSIVINGKLASTTLNNVGNSFSNLAKGSAAANKAAAATKKATKATKEATDQVAEFGRVSGLALRRNAGFILATGAIYGLGRAISSSFSEAVRFEKELVKVAQVSNRSVGSLQPLVNEITRLSTTLGVASDDLIDISLILAQAGLSANETKQALEALAKTTLAATFGDIRDTTEGAIALMAQFEISAKDLSKALGATNAVSAAFAVESEDIIAAVKRSGGVFAQTSKGVAEGTDAFNQFIAVFSAVRSTTRESAESIATGLRTIFTRIQRPQTIAFLKELGIELTDLEGKFVGPFEAVNRLTKGLENADRRGSTFAKVSEELGGFRQIGKTLALLSSSEQRIKALQVAQSGQNSINKDAEQAQVSLANAIAKTREEFTALIREIAQTPTFDALVRSVLGLANGLILLASAVKPVIPLIAALGAVKAINFGSRFIKPFKQGLGIQRLAVGGRVTGGKGLVDDVPAMLTAGEFVINKKSASVIGKHNLEELNKMGRAKGFARGGAVGRVQLADGGFPEDDQHYIDEVSKNIQKFDRAIEKRIRKLNQKLTKLRSDVSPNEEKIAQTVQQRDNLSDLKRRRNLRNETTDPRLSKLLTGGGPSPALEANVGGKLAQARNGRDLTASIVDNNFQTKLTEGFKKAITKAVELAAASPQKKPKRFVDASSQFGGLLGGTSPSVEAVVGGRRVTGTARSVADDLDAPRRAANRRFNKEQERLQFNELAKGRLRQGNQFDPVAARAIQESVTTSEAARNANEQRKAQNREHNRRQLFEQEKRLGRREQQVALGSRATAARLVDRRDTFNSRSPGPNIHNNAISRILQSDTNNSFGFRPGDAFGAGNLTAAQLQAEETARLATGQASASSTTRNAAQKAASRAATQQRLRAAKIQQLFPTFSRLRQPAVPNSLQAFNNATGGSGGGPSGGGLGSKLKAGGNFLKTGGLLTVVAGGALVGDKIGGGAGGAVTGAAAGAAIGSLAGPVGIAVGGIIGAFNGFIQADLDTKIQESSDKMIKGISNIEETFKNFKTEDLVKDMQRVRIAFAGTSNNVVNSGRANFQKGAAGFGTRVQTVLGEGINNLQNLIGFGDIDSSIEKTQTKRIKANRDNALTTAQAEAAPAIEAAQKTLAALLDTGLSFEQAAEQLGRDGKFALALGQAKVGTTTGDVLGNKIASGDVAGAQSDAEKILAQTGANSIKAKTLAEKKANDLVKESAKAFAELSQQTDLFIDRMNNLSAVLDRVSSAGDGFTRQNESILSRRGGGAGIPSQVRRNVFENTRAFTLEETKGEARRINQELGNNANSRELANGAIASKKLELNLPGVLREFDRRTSLGGAEEGLSVLPSLLKSNFGDLPPVLLKKLEEDIKKKFTANEQTTPNDISQTLAAGAAQELSGDTIKTFNSAMSKYTEVFNKNITEFEQALDTWVGLLNEANQAEDNRTQILVSNANIEKQLNGGRLSIADRSRGFESQLAAFSGRAGSSGTSVRALAFNEDKANSQRFAQVRGDADEVAKHFASLSVQQQNSLKALELIASNTDRQVALQQDLNGLLDSRKAARQVLEDFQFGSPTEKREIERSIILAKQQLEGVTLSSTQAKKAREGQRILSTLTGAVQGEDAVQQLDKRFIDVLDRGNSGKLFGLAGVNPGVGVGDLLNNRDALFQGQFRQLQGVNREQADAAGAITEINRRDANQFLQNGQDKFNSVKNGLQEALSNGGLLDRLNETLSAIPEQIEIGGALSVNFNVNGAEALAQMQPWAVELVTNEVRRQMNQRLNPFTGESNPA